MHLAYSALNQISTDTRSAQQPNNNEQLLRYQAYQQTCEKYSSTIAAIQKYLPGWTPKFY